MIRSKNLPTTHVMNTRTPDNNTTSIINEYTLKRQSFNPLTSSPNIFMNKLEHRMALYYSSLYSSCNSKKK
jgi:hypothetical protein